MTDKLKAAFIKPDISSGLIYTLTFIGWDSWLLMISWLSFLDIFPILKSILTSLLTTFILLILSQPICLLGIADTLLEKSGHIFN